MTPLLRPFLRTWAASSIAAAPALPTPAGEPVVVVPGADPDRVLLVGAGPAASPGADDWSAAVPGHLARALSGLTGRGAVVEARGAHRARMVDLPALIAGARLQRFDALVLCVGLEDGAAGVSAARWRRELAAVVDGLRRDGSRDVTVVLVRIPPVSSVGIYRGPQVLLADRNVRALNRAILRLARDRQDVLTVAAPVPAPPAPAGSQPWFERCGAAFAALLHERFAGPAAG